MNGLLMLYCNVLERYLFKDLLKGIVMSSRGLGGQIGWSVRKSDNLDVLFDKIGSMM